MANSGSGLSEEDKTIIKDWMKDKWREGANCSVCGVNNWQVGDHLVASPIAPKSGGMVIGGSVYPQVMSICTNCGHTVYFNAVVIGVIEPGVKEVEGSQEAEDG